ncbi:solute carrier family 38 member 7 [Phyllostomus discolor]|uniref:Sodium-coupled neutral amino acid transporter 7 n=1 Tax=Phyllostomus discolor TaxID=89673 RepID=A0A834DG13_9CHIR|nr:solute carrier family 38 member 7 [Phyllostomus discolor]
MAQVSINSDLGEWGFSTDAGERARLLQSPCVDSDPKGEAEASPENLSGGATSTFGAIFIVVNACLGAGLLNFPAAFSTAGGVAAGISLQMGMLVFIISGLVILAYCSQASNERTYQEVVWAVCGKVTGVLCEVSIAIYTFGTCITFLIIIGDQQLVGAGRLRRPPSHPGSLHLRPDHSQRHLCGPVGITTASRGPHGLCPCTREPISYSRRTSWLASFPSAGGWHDIWMSFSSDGSGLKSGAAPPDSSTGLRFCPPVLTVPQMVAQCHRGAPPPLSASPCLEPTGAEGQQAPEERLQPDRALEEGAQRAPVLRRAAGPAQALCSFPRDSAPAAVRQQTEQQWLPPGSGSVHR